MANFIYKARDNQGLPIKGAVEAADDLTVAINLRKLGYRVVSVQRQSELARGLKAILQKIKKVPRQEIIIFTQQLSAMLKAGLPIAAALSSIAEQIKSESLRAAIENILKDIEGGD